MINVERRHGLPSFAQLLLAVAEAWKMQRDDVVDAGTTARRGGGHSARIEPSAEPLTAALLDDAERGIARTFEPTYGGFGGRRSSRPRRRSSSSSAAASPRRWRWCRRRSTGWLPAACTTSSAAASTATRSTSGGSCRTSRRCSTTTRCSPPRTCTASLVTGEPRYRAIVEETLDYVLRELRLPEAVSRRRRTPTPTASRGSRSRWTEEEGVPGASSSQPFEHGRSIIRGQLDRRDCARGCSPSAQQRPQPGLDDKVLASWNGLALAALAEAGRRLERTDWLDAARGVGEFLLGPLSRDDGRLSRSWREGQVSGEGFLDDYANVAHGLLELHVATGELRWLEEARRLALLAVDLFARSRARRLLPRPDRRRELVARTKGSRRQPDPVRQLDARARAAPARPDLGRRRARAPRRVRAPARRRRCSARAPGAFGWTLCALDLWLSPPREIAIVGPAESAVARAALAPFAPNTVAAFGPADGVPLLEGKALVDGKPAVYVCERFACQAPVTDPADLRSD